ncbi:transglutaminase-like cysteine peptidase [Streptomyces sp. NPDC051577]|uniref:transglutaminase-like cysteine peptidase n=1 Tax=Streptomyces sp. NPDC051577 TaxID=3155166 RepID=UPI00342BCAB6
MTFSIVGISEEDNPMTTRNVTLHIAAFIGVLTLGPSTLLAAGVGGYARDLGTTAKRIVEGEFTLAPLASVAFCMKNTDQCRDTGGDVVELTDARQGELFGVNSKVNRSIRPKNDSPTADVWSVDVAAGDCEDYALTKRKRLLELGWPSRALRMAVATTPSGEGHAVLVVRTSQGDLVLDNRTSQVKDWAKTDLSWLKMQSSNPEIWVSMQSRPNRPVLVSERTKDHRPARVMRKPPTPVAQVFSDIGIYDTRK